MSNLDIVDLQAIADPRGSLMVAEFGRHVPFVVRRIFVVHDVPVGAVRGQHAHRACHQFLIAIAGRVAVVLDDGAERKTIELGAIAQGLHVPPGVWGEQTYLSDDAALLVLTSDPYDAQDYISDYDAFRREFGVAA